MFVLKGISVILGKVIPALPEEVKKRVGERGEKLKLRDYKVEYATTGRSKCRKCVENIDRGDIRLSKRGYSPERAKMFGPQVISNCLKPSSERKYMENTNKVIF